MADLKPGSSTISKIYAGSSEVQKVYAGSTLVYQVSSAAADWDTYENGIWQEVENHDTSSMYNTGGYLNVGALQLKAMTTNQSTWGDYITGWWSYSNRPTAALSSGYTAGDAPPYVAVWDCDLGHWLDVEPFAGIGSDRAIYDDGVGNRMFQTYTASKTNNCVFVGLTQDPGDISGWRDYDGPDDWDTWEDGIVCYPDPGTSYGTSSALVMTDVKATSSYDTPVRFTQKSSTTLWLQRADNSVNGGLLTSYPPYIALWWERTGSTVVRTWFVAEYSGSGATYNFVEAANGYTQFHATSNSTGDLAIVSLTRQPTNLANWRDYDGPLFASWDAVDRVTLVAGASGVATTRINIDYYEKGSFWTTISQSGTDEMVPIALDRGGTSLVNMQLDSGDVMNRDTLNSNVSSAASWFANLSSPYNGWQNVPLTSTGTYKTNYVFDMSPTGLNYNNFYTYEPASVVLFNEDAGDTRYWPAYDGPVANWDTYANGVFVMKNLSADRTVDDCTLIPVPAYATHTYNAAMDDHLEVVSGSTTTAGGSVKTPRNTPAENADSPPYIAVYIHQYHDSQDGTHHNAKGWYVFQRPTIPSVDANMDYTPYAWPSDLSTGYNNAYVTEGAIGSGGTDTGYFVVFLDEYNDPVGAGGTDHWTAAPYFIYNSAPVISSGRVYPNQGSGTIMLSDRETHCDLYSFGMVREYSGTTVRFLVESHSAYGNADYQVYANGNLYMQGVVNLSVATGGAVSSFDTIESGYTGTIATDFNEVTGVGDPVFILVYTDTSKP